MSQVDATPKNYNGRVIVRARTFGGRARAATGIETTGVGTSSAYFDVDGDLFAERTGWLKGDDGFLVLDSNGAD